MQRLSKLELKIREKNVYRLIVLNLFLMAYLFKSFTSIGQSYDRLF